MKDMPDHAMQSPAAAAGARASSSRRVLVIGGGASGVLLTAHLMERGGADLSVTLIERRETLGCGLAYSTPDPAHLLNTRVHAMSAFPDRPHHFEAWLHAQPGSGALDGESFASRLAYGRYLSDLLEPWQAPAAARLDCLRGDCLRIEETAQGVRAHLADGRVVEGTQAVLATGHVLPQRGAGDALLDPWPAGGSTPDGGRCPQGRVVILGTGLTMIDQALSLLDSGHEGEIVAVSRRGLLPRAHRPTRPTPLARAEIPLGRPLSDFLHWLRARARAAEAAGGSWRDAMDAVRPHVRAIWRSLSTEERARFLRHGAAWWEVHRHRMPPASEARIDEAMARGRLRILRAGFLDAEREGGTVSLRLAPRAAGVPARLDAVRVIDCRGIRRDPRIHATPLVADLLARGAARIDPLRIGVEVTADCRLIGASGRPSARIRAMGPVSRATFWEITAIPDIREQAAAIATDLVAAGS